VPVRAERPAAAGVLSREFLDRPAIEVAPDLLGCVLEHETAEGLVAVTLTEVEAYAGEADPASHAYRGRTRRNAVMYGPPGYAYVYFTYGMHFCVNVVCSPPGTATAVLLRAGRVIAGEELARRRRTARGRAAEDGQDRATPVTLAARDLARGPARLCQALGIARDLDGADLCAPTSPLRLRPPAAGPAAAVPSDSPPPAAGRHGAAATARSGEQVEIRTGPRVGVREGADVPWRFWIAGDPTVSVYRPHTPRRR